jgi:hypothetical protein
MNLENLFAGASMLENTSDAVKVTMKSGLATLSNVTAHTSKKGNACAKLVFRTLLAPDDETQGHEEYISLSEGARFARVFGKLVYLVKHSKNQEAINAFLALPNPVTVLKNEQGQPLVFTTNDELEGIRNSFGEDVTFIWNDDSENKERTAIKFNNPEEYIQQLINVFGKFVGDKYKLDVKQDAERGFQRLVSINAPKL